MHNHYHTPKEHPRYLHIDSQSPHRAQVPLWQQQSSTQEDGLVVWDYHVGVPFAASPMLYRHALAHLQCVAERKIIAIPLAADS